MSRCICLFGLILAWLPLLRGADRFVVKLHSVDSLTITDAILGNAETVLIDARDAKIDRVIFDFKQHRDRIVLNGGEIDRVEIRRCDVRALYVDRTGTSVLDFGIGPIRIEYLFVHRTKLNQLFPVHSVIGLRYISVSDNKISDPDFTVIKGVNLDFLNLANNGITKIEAVEPIAKLGGLDLRDNRLSSLATSILEINGLTELYLRGNCFRTDAQARISAEAKSKNIELDWEEE